MYRLTCSMVAQVPLAQVFGVFEDPRNLAKITPAWLNFRILHPETVNMRAGAMIDYEIRWLGLPLRWRTLITEYAPPFLFVDEQARGPYSVWRHRHTFRETDAGIEIGDRVDYQLPLGPLGRAAHALAVKRQLLGIFQFRQRAIANMLEGAEVSFSQPVIVYL